MLYPKKNRPFEEREFQSPGSEYRSAPFWAWNNKLDRDELLWQIDRLKEMGFGGFHMHVRTGLATPYLSDEYMQVVGACVDKARREGMKAYLYDEDRWPSGAAGGRVTKNREFRQRTLLFSRRPPDAGELLAAFDVALHPDGTLKRYAALAQGDRAQGFALYASMQTMPDMPWFNNQAYLDTLCPEGVREFIRTTHERYKACIGDAFGKTVPSIFTDEPQFSGKETLRFATDERDVTLPWTPGLEKLFYETYGRDLLAGLPELLWELPDGKVSVLRYEYHDLLAERFAQAFADQCGAWCEANHIELTGHVMSEPTLESQTMALGEAMRSYRSFQRPGIDMLCDWREFTTAKQAQSAARQYGREGTLSELYGVTNWHFDFRGHKLQGDWQAALGVTLRVPHLAWVSMNGEAKRDYPASINYQAPWYKAYKLIEDHFARVNTVLTRGRPVCRVAVIHPVESYWLHWGARENTAAIRKQMDEDFVNLTEWLLRGLIDFDFISEALLVQLQPDVTGGEGFQVGAMRYAAVIVPRVETIRKTTLERLSAYRRAGGRVVFLGDTPPLMDAVPSDQPSRLYARCEHVRFDRVSVLGALAAEREIEVRDSQGETPQNLLYQLREEGDIRWLFLSHADNPDNPDLPVCQRLSIRLRGSWRAELLDTLQGVVRPLPTRTAGGWTGLETDLYDHDSLLLRMTPGTARERAGASQSACATLAARFLKPAAVTLHEPNVLLLDMAEYRLDDQPWQPSEEILRLDNRLRGQLGWPLRGTSYAQPWVASDVAAQHRLRLRYRIASEAEIRHAGLAMENARGCAVTLNGEPAGAVDGWYVDKCIERRPLPALHAGDNVLEISMPYGRVTDVESCFLLGDFGVRVAGCSAVLTEGIQKLCFGDITRQGLPFYGGNLTWRLEADLEPGMYELQISQYRGSLIAVKVDGADQGKIVFSPYTLRFAAAESRTYAIDVTLYGTRINTFGQVHHTDKSTKWWGPDSWRSEGASWSYEYQLWPQGILKSPELFRIEGARQTSK